MISGHLAAATANNIADYELFFLFGIVSYLLCRPSMARAVHFRLSPLVVLTDDEIILGMKIYFTIDRTARHQRSICVDYTGLGLELAKQYKRGLIEQQGYKESEITISATDDEGKLFVF